MLTRIRKSLNLLTVAIISALLAVLLINGQDNTFTITSYGIERNKDNDFDQDYTMYNELLQRHVSDGSVDYRGFINSQTEFTLFLKSLGDVDPADFDTWTEDEKMAFWINAYNAFTIKAIIDNYPIQRSFSLVGIFYAPSNSILQIKGVWKKLEFRAVGSTVTLDQIEHEILRIDFNEPRIHMAIVCASISCPDLRNEAYTGGKLVEQLEAASVNFVNDPDKGALINERDGRVKVSRIFKWFGDDFISNYGNSATFKEENAKNNAVLNFITEYLSSEKDKKFLLEGSFEYGYLKYDWNLNEPPAEEEDN